MHAFMFYFLFRDFYIEAYRKRKSTVQLKKKEEEERKQREKNGSVKRNDAKENGAIYANQYKMATGYISDNGLRNRVFIDNRGFKE